MKKIVLLILIGAEWYLAAMYHSHLLLALSMTTAVLLVVLFVMPRIQKQGYKAAFTLSGRTMTKGAQEQVEMENQKRGLLPLPRLRYDILAQYEGEKKPARLKFVGGCQSKRDTLQLPLQPKYSGMLTLHLKKARLYDPLGIFSSSKKQDSQIRLAVLPQMSTYTHMIPEIVARFKDRYPNITLEIMEAGGSEMRAAIAEHRISMGFLTRKEADRNFISLCSDDMLAIVPEDSPLADREVMDLDELAQYPYIGVNIDYDHDVEYIVKKMGFSAKPFLVSRDEQAIIAMVREGLGVSIVAGLHVAFDSEGIVGIPLKPRYLRDVGLAIVSEESLSPAERKFIEVAQEVVADMIKDGLVLPPRLQETE